MTLTSDPAPFTEEDHEMQLKAKKKTTKLRLRPLIIC